MLVNNAVELLLLCLLAANGVVFEMQYNMIVVLFCLNIEAHQVYIIVVAQYENTKEIQRDSSHEEEIELTQQTQPFKINIRKIITFNCILFAIYIFIM